MVSTFRSFCILLSGNDVLLICECLASILKGVGGDRHKTESEKFVSLNVLYGVRH